MFLHRFLLLSLAAFVLINTLEALREIAKTIGKRDWNFSVDPCSGEWGWASLNPVKGSENAVTCNCSFANATLCHVVSLVVKTQNLPGVLPPEVVRLPFLQEIDLTRNYLNGSIPPEWGSLKLVNISLIGNRLTGPIPKALANISTLTSLTLEFNQLSGSLPPELGDLPSLERILISSNNFSGALPATFAKLTTMKDFRISDNRFSGQIPNFIQNWTKLEKLVVQASGLVGPIPSGIAALEKLSDLRISDLNGTEATFPSLVGMKKMKILILRSCNIIGKLPEYLGQMTTLKTLDLSFNKLSGEIPSSFSGLIDVDNIYLTGNLLTGSVPPWMLEKGGNMNLFASSSKGNNSGAIVSCLRSFKFPKTYYSLHINCGGKEEMANGNTTFEDDTTDARPSKFVLSRSNWASSTTGHFLDDDRPSETYIWTNSSRLLMNDSQLYMQARLSPISLTYYGFCMGNGNYSVNLHFAEIMFSDDKTYNSFGRRIFDVYVQGKLVLKDFNIEDEAGGAAKAIIKTFTVAVTNNTLEIRLFWAGKGTVGIPFRGVYGPLISAISVTPSPEEHQLNLDWPTRHRICVGIARGLAYLHEESRLKIVHRDIKATNVLLDKDLNPKISDFGLAKLDEEDNTHISTRIAGTL
ncbi:hypothetical protein EZV62_007947 [Acer yangbiense]|uniref:non-specific serine/threonine protein kinase n=1 Tax=Acer yangbiense TaxID=1000413 RepID=A0A5C7ICV1_9ROSI|nr:hypothetical protein EZV62_007947 [Acer yangbiense]